MTAGAPQADAAAGTPPVANLGDVLRTARVAQELTIEQLATELRIEARQLLALEENRLEQIGVPVFVKGYLRQYGQRLGIDYRDLLDLYYKQTKLAEVQIQPSRTIKLRDDRQVTVWVLTGVVLLALIVGMAAWWWNDGVFRFDLTTFTNLTNPPIESAPTPASAAAGVTAASSPVSPPAPIPTSTPPPSPAEPVVAPEPVNAAAGAAPAEPLQPVPADPATMPLVLTFASESWAEITDGRGERLFYGLGAAGQRVTASGEPPFAIVLGNADAVELTVDGEPYPVPMQGRQGNLVRFSVDIAEE